MSPRAALAAACAAVLAAGCAATGPFEAHVESEAPVVRECAAWYRGLDDLTRAAGVADAQTARLPDFPYLRVDRFHAALRERAARSQGALQAYAERLLQLELQARLHEARNLPPEAWQSLPRPPSDAAEGFRRTAECARLLREIDLAKPALQAAMLEQSRAPDDYSDLARVLGLYPLTRLVFSAGVRRWEAATSVALAAPPAPLDQAGGVRYAPPRAEPIARPAVGGILARARLDPLGVPQLSAQEFASIAAAYAPTLETEVTGRFDRFGAVRWRRGEPYPEVDFAEPVVYAHPTHTLYEGRVLLQLVYHLWLPERPADGAFDLLAGRMDGLVWRVTLAPDGEPVLFDAIHACGCYHMFFPTPRARPRRAPDALEEWAFVPRALPALAQGERVIVRLASRTHDIRHVSVERGGESLARYLLRSYDELRSLPLPGGGARSLFDPDGFVPGTERAERYLFWPMGIASAGAMRQWGRHATAFVGRRHFDDADLIERRFELDLEPAS